MWATASPVTNGERTFRTSLPQEGRASAAIFPPRARRASASFPTDGEAPPSNSLPFPAAALFPNRPFPAAALFPNRPSLPRPRSGAVPLLPSKKAPRPLRKRAAPCAGCAKSALPPPTSLTTICSPKRTCPPCLAQGRVQEKIRESAASVGEGRRLSPNFPRRPRPSPKNMCISATAARRSIFSRRTTTR